MEQLTVLYQGLPDFAAITDLLGTLPGGDDVARAAARLEAWHRYNVDVEGEDVVGIVLKVALMLVLTGLSLWYAFRVGPRRSPGDSAKAVVVRAGPNLELDIPPKRTYLEPGTAMRFEKFKTGGVIRIRSSEDWSVFQLGAAGSDLRVLTMLTAEWNRPFAQLYPLVLDASERFANVLILAKIDINEVQAAADESDLSRGLPVFQVRERGRVVEELAGKAATREAVLDLLDRLQEDHSRREKKRFRLPPGSPPPISAPPGRK
eukprot:EG_transcript_14942